MLLQTGGFCNEGDQVIARGRTHNKDVIVVVDREEGAHTALADEGVELIPLVRIGIVYAVT